MRLLSLASGIALAMTATLAAAQTQPSASSAPAPAAAPQAAKYSSSTSTLGAMLADPGAKAVLQKHLPQLLNNDGPGGNIQEQAGGMTLKEIQEATRAYAPDALSDKVLAAIDQDLAKLPAKN